jgi:hypothetical protein
MKKKQLAGSVPTENSESIEKSGDFTRRPMMSPACSHSSLHCSAGSIACVWRITNSGRT